MPDCRSYRGTRARLASRVGRCGRRPGGMVGQIERGLPLATARRRSRLGDDGRAYASLAPGCAFSADPSGQDAHTDQAAEAGPSCPPGAGAKQYRSYTWVQRAPAAGNPKAQGPDGKASPPRSRASRRHRPLGAARRSVARSVRSTEVWLSCQGLSHRGLAGENVTGVPTGSRADRESRSGPRGHRCTQCSTSSKPQTKQVDRGGLDREPRTPVYDRTPVTARPRAASCVGAVERDRGHARNRCQLATGASTSGGVAASVIAGRNRRAAKDPISSRPNATPRSRTVSGSRTERRGDDFLGPTAPQDGTASADATRT